MQILAKVKKKLIEFKKNNSENQYFYFADAHTLWQKYKVNFVNNPGSK